MAIRASLALAICLFAGFANSDGEAVAHPASDHTFVTDGTTTSVGRERCLKVLLPLSTDTAPLSENFAPAACRAGTIARAFRYDAASASTRIARPLAAGEIVPVFPEFGMDMVRPGQSLALVIASGPVRIEREVEALQAARPGQRLFVRSHDGQILSVRYEKVAP